VMGHEIMRPDGYVIRIDRDALAELQKKRLLIRHRRAFHPRIVEVLHIDGLLSDRLRQHLGPDLSGPEVCVCHCQDCSG